jgi:hypothetical protein
MDTECKRSNLLKIGPPADPEDVVVVGTGNKIKCLGLIGCLEQFTA